MDNATVSLSGAVPQGAAVTVTCLKPKHHVLFGNKEVTCQSGGWSDKPECRKCGKFLSKVFTQQSHVNYMIRCIDASCYFDEKVGLTVKIF